MIIAGAGGHAREILDILDLKGGLDIVCFDNINDPLPAEISNQKVIRDIEILSKNLETSPAFILGTGVPAARKKLFELFISMGGKPEVCLAPTAVISQRSVTIGEGCNIMHCAFVSNHVQIGKGSLVNARAHLHHDVSVGDFTELGPGCIILGRVKIGSEVMIGSGAIVLPGIEIGDRAQVGAGAVVTKNIEAGAMVKGNPAR